MDAQHVLGALNPNASNLQATATSLAECTQLQQHHTELVADRASELVADRVRDVARADVQLQKVQSRVQERLRSASRQQSAGGEKRKRERESRVRRRQHTHTHTRVSLIPPWEDQCEWHRMTRMTGPDCAVMCNLINTYTHTHTHTLRNKYH